MEWFAFLIYFLFSMCGAFVVWTVIRVGFRNSDIEESVSIEAGEQKSASANNFDRKRHLYWNFTATLIVVPALLLVLGITVKTAPLNHPITGTLIGALGLIWGMALWSGMLAFSDQTPLDNKTHLPDIPEHTTTGSGGAKQTIDPKEAS